MLRGQATPKLLDHLLDGQLGFENVDPVLKDDVFMVDVAAEVRILNSFCHWVRRQFRSCLEIPWQSIVDGQAFLA